MTFQTETSSAAAPTANGALGAGFIESKPRDDSSDTARRKARVGFIFPPGGEVRAVQGRLAQTLSLLIQRGSRGFTSGEASPLGWARRTSAYIHKLRRLGLPIVTTREATGDGALVARYSLLVPVEVAREVVP